MLSFKNFVNTIDFANKYLSIFFIFLLIFDKMRFRAKINIAFEKNLWVITIVKFKKCLANTRIFSIIASKF